MFWSRRCSARSDSGSSAEPKKPKRPELKNHKSPREKKQPACLLCFSSSGGEMFRMHGMSGEDCAVDPIFSLIQQHFSSQRKPLSLQEIGSMGSEENLSQQFVFFSPQSLSSFSVFAYNEKKVELSMPFQDVLKFMEYEAAQILRFVKKENQPNNIVRVGVSG